MNHSLIYVAAYQKCSGTCLRTVLPGDIFSVGHMAVFVRLLLNMAHPQTGRIPPHDESAPEEYHKHEMN